MVPPFSLPFSLLLILTSHGTEYPFGQSSQTVPSVFPLKHLPTPSPLGGGGLQRPFMQGQHCSGTAKALGWDQQRCSHEHQAQQAALGKGKSGASSNLCYCVTQLLFSLQSSMKIQVTERQKCSYKMHQYKHSSSWEEHFSSPTLVRKSVG